MPRSAGPIRQKRAVMSSNIIAAMLAFLGGAVIALINSLIMAKQVKTESQSLSKVSLIRQALSLAYFAAVFFIVRAIPIEPLWPLIGAATGLTIPSILFAFTIAKNMKKGDD